MVYLVFGRPGKGNNTMGIDDTKGRSSIGQGVVIRDKFHIISADHVYEEGIKRGATTLWVQVDENVWVQYDVDDLRVEEGPGDTVIITLPHQLPGDVRPAEEDGDYKVKSGDSLVLTYAEPIRDKEGRLTGFSQHTTRTTYSPRPLFGSPDMMDGRYGLQPLLKNPNMLLKGGDSGGGVFYNNQLIGVNSSVKNSWVAIATLCLRVSWGKLAPC
jgi:hypothetical protein